MAVALSGKTHGQPAQLRKRQGRGQAQHRPKFLADVASLQHKNDLTTLKAVQCEQSLAKDSPAAACDFSFLAKIGLSAICGLHNRGRLGVRIIFQNGVVTGGDLRGILYGTTQFKTNTPMTSLAKRKPAACQQHGFMH
jgi:hypothetical protein